MPLYNAPRLPCSANAIPQDMPTPGHRHDVAVVNTESGEPTRLPRRSTSAQTERSIIHGCRFLLIPLRFWREAPVQASQDLLGVRWGRRR
jgi:hypothetical protein